MLISPFSPCSFPPPRGLFPIDPFLSPPLPRQSCCGCQEAVFQPGGASSQIAETTAALIPEACFILATLPPPPPLRPPHGSIRFHAYLWARVGEGGGEQHRQRRKPASALRPGLSCFLGHRDRGFSWVGGGGSPVLSLLEFGFSGFCRLEGRFLSHESWRVLANGSSLSPSPPPPPPPPKKKPQSIFVKVIV